MGAVLGLKIDTLSSCQCLLGPVGFLNMAYFVRHQLPPKTQKNNPENHSENPRTNLENHSQTPENQKKQKTHRSRISSKARNIKLKGSGSVSLLPDCRWTMGDASGRVSRVYLIFAHKSEFPPKTTGFLHQKSQDACVEEH